MAPPLLEQAPPQSAARGPGLGFSDPARRVLGGYLPGTQPVQAPPRAPFRLVDETLEAGKPARRLAPPLSAPPLSAPPPRIVCGFCPGALGRVAGTQEFQVPDEVLGLIYAQTVVWVGSFFCPLLPLLNTVKFLLLFYLKKVRSEEDPASEYWGLDP